MGLTIILLAATAIAPPATVWHMQGKPGAVTSVTGTVKTGGRIVADEMVDDPDLEDDERGILASGTFRPGTCSFASAVRPFRRLRRFAADGRLLWEWHVDRAQQALRLHSGNGDCLSPDGGRLTVRSYLYNPADGEPVVALGEGVVAVDHKPRFVDAQGARTHQQFGDGHATQLVGWRRGSPATLLFEVVTDADTPGGPKVTPDFVVLAGKR